MTRTPGSHVLASRGFLVQSNRRSAEEQRSPVASRQVRSVLRAAGRPRAGVRRDGRCPAMRDPIAFKKTKPGESTMAETMTEREAGREAREEGGAKAMRMKKLGVVGAGTMGSGIAALAASAGVPVVLLDIPGPDGDRSAPARTGLERARKARPAALMAPARAGLITL